MVSLCHLAKFCGDQSTVGDFFNFQNGGHPLSWFLKIRNFNGWLYSMG